jgi:hypothetical protein
MLGFCREVRGEVEPGLRSLRARAAAGMLALAAAALALGCTGLVDRWSGREEACAILAAGLPATATVLELRDSGTTINDDPVVIFVLRVEPAEGELFTAESRALVSRLDVPQVQPGRVLPVRYDPADPARVALDLWECPPPKKER